MRVLNELITKEDAINAVNRYRTSIMDTKRAIYALPSAQQWIPCSERLPMVYDMYLVTEQNFGGKEDARRHEIVTHTSYYYGNHRWTDRFYANDVSNIVAWMPLPKPYREDGEA